MSKFTKNQGAKRVSDYMQQTVSQKFGLLDQRRLRVQFVVEISISFHHRLNGKQVRKQTACVFC